MALCGLAEAQSNQDADAIRHLTTAFNQVREPSLRMAAGTRLYSLLMGTGDLERATHVIAKLQQLDPTNIDVLYAAHQVYSLLAYRAFQSMAQIAPGSARMYELQGDELAQVPMPRILWPSPRRTHQLNSPTRSEVSLDLEPCFRKLVTNLIVPRSNSPFHLHPFTNSY